MLAREDSFWWIQVIGRGLDRWRGVGLFFPPIEESSPLPEETGSPERLLLGQLVQTLTALLGCKKKKEKKVEYTTPQSKFDVRKMVICFMISFHLSY